MVLLDPETMYEGGFVISAGSQAQSLYNGKRLAAGPLFDTVVVYRGGMNGDDAKVQDIALGTHVHLYKQELVRGDKVSSGAIVGCEKPPQGPWFIATDSTNAALPTVMAGIHRFRIPIPIHNCFLLMYHFKFGHLRSTTIISVENSFERNLGKVCPGRGLAL